ncbi:DUF6380 family protein [Streptomyces paradoxus]|uniref:DUF6380 family protein n=1 Tax=Streptomyces paradoxus TaxID=66375 RepID=UPI0038191387
MTNRPVQGDTTDGHTARDEVEPVVFPVCRQGRVGLGARVRAARVAERGCDAVLVRDEVEPVSSPVRRRGRAAGAGDVAGPAGRGCDAPLGRTVGDNRRATLRRGAASLTETAGRAPIERHGRRARKGA